MTSLEGARLVDDDNINRVLVFYFLKIYKSAVNLPLCSVFFPSLFYLCCIQSLGHIKGRQPCGWKGTKKASNP